MSIPCYPLHVLIALRDEDLIARYQLDQQAGKLIRLDNFQLSGGPAPICISQDCRHLYVGLRDTNELAVVAVSADGSLNMLERKALGLNPVHINLSCRHRYLFAASYSHNAWSAFSLDAEGQIMTAVIEPVVGVEKAHQVMIREDFGWVMVPALGMDTLFIYDLSSLNGQPVLLEKLAMTNGSGPRHLVWHPSEPVFFVVNELLSSVTMVEYQRTTDSFIVHEQVSCLPVEYRGSSTAAQIRISPDGRHLYVSNRGHDSVAVLQFSQRSKELQLLSNVSSEPVPRAIALDPLGRWLIAAGQHSGYAVLYERNLKSGLLTEKDRVETGQEAYWVEFLSLVDTSS